MNHFPLSAGKQMRGDLRVITERPLFQNKTRNRGPTWLYCRHSLFLKSVNCFFNSRYFSLELPVILKIAVYFFA